MLTPLLTVLLAAAPAGATQVQREPVALMPLQSGLGTPAQLGEAWAPLMADLIADHGKTLVYAATMKLKPAVRALIAQCRTAQCYQEIAAALGAKKLVAGGVTREGLRYFLTLTLHDLTTFKQLARVERTWAGATSLTNNPLDRELAAALDELFGTPVVAVADASPRNKPPPVEVTKTETIAEVRKAPPPPVANGAQTTIMTKIEQPSPYLYRTPAWTFTVLGAAGVIAGVSLLVANQVMTVPFAAAVKDYNSTPVRTQAAFDALRSREQTLGGLQLGTSVALGVGAAALTAGIVLFAIDGKAKSSKVAFVPLGPGASVVGRF